jgi:hypothetical protein
LKKNNNICINSRKKVKATEEQVGDLVKSNAVGKIQILGSSRLLLLACKRLVVMMSFQALSDLILR